MTSNTGSNTTITVPMTGLESFASSASLSSVSLPNIDGNSVSVTAVTTRSDIYSGVQYETVPFQMLINNINLQSTQFVQQGYDIVLTLQTTNNTALDNHNIPPTYTTVCYDRYRSIYTYECPDGLPNLVIK